MDVSILQHLRDSSPQQVAVAEVVELIRGSSRGGGTDSRQSVATRLPASADSGQCGNGGPAA